MNSIRSSVKTALTGVCACVVYGYPLDMAGATRLCWRESENRVYARADGREHLTELEYTIDVFAPGPEAAEDICTACDAALTALGLCRTGAHVVQDEDGAHRTLVYRGLADGGGKLYQS